MSDIRPLTKQEVFNTVWQYFVIEGHAQSVGPSSLCFPYTISCVYKAEDTKCAIGIFIPDEEYSTALEEDALSDVIEACPTTKVLLEDVRGEFLSSLQQAHDTAAQDLYKYTNSGREYVPLGLEPRLRLFARNHGLEIPEGDNQ